MSENQKITLTDSQLTAIKSESKRIAVIAGPGSGKTRVLTERICNLILRKGVIEGTILALSYSSKAAKEVRKRLKNQLGDTYYKVAAKTFHSFGLQIIRENFDLLGYTETLDILTTNTRNKILRKILNNNNIDDKSLMDYSLKISQVKNGEPLVDPVLIKILDQYNKELKRINTIDFDDMIALPLKLLQQNPEIHNKYRRKFKHILIDEVQDLNDYQIQLLQLLLNDETSLFVVGDDDQCIYEWRGAKPDFLKAIVSEDEIEVIKLEDNFRSDSAIVSISGSLIGNNELRIKKNTTARKLRKNSQLVSSEATIAKRFYDPASEANYIAEEIDKLVSSGTYNYNDFAVLIRNTAQAGAIKMAFERSGIPCFEQISESCEYDEFIHVLKTIINFNKNNGINKAINYPIMIMDNFLYAEISEKIKLEQGTSVLEGFEILYNMEDDFEDSDVFRNRYRTLKELHEQVSELSVSSILIQLLDLYSKEPFANYKKAKEKLEYIHNLLDIAKDFETTCISSEKDTVPLQEFLDYITLSSQDESSETTPDSAVNLMTCHKSKGLEFPVVFIPGVQVGVFPKSFFIRSKKELEAERRLFYVSITRAINKLYITCYENPFVGDGIVKRGFLAEIPGIRC